MGKILSILGGIALIMAALGLLALKPFNVDFLAALIIIIEGAIPPVLALLGLLLLLVGIEDMKSSPTAKQAPSSPAAPVAPVMPAAPVSEIGEPKPYEIHGKKKKR